MVISIHQPDYIPYPGYFYKMAHADIFVYLDDCQFSNDNMHHWNRIKTPQGECRLKIPTEYHFGDAINQVRTKDELKWKEKHLKTIEMNYSRALYFRDIFPDFRELLLSPYPNLARQNMEIDTWIARRFGLHPRYYKTSDMKLDSRREERVIEICSRLGGDVYLSGNGAKAYQVEEHFTSRGIRLSYTDYHAATYPQQWGGFLPGLSVLDYMFQCGFNWEGIEQNLGEKA